MFTRDRMVVHGDTDDFSSNSYWEDTVGDIWKVKYINPYNNTITLVRVGWFKSLLIKWGWI